MQVRRWGEGERAEELWRCRVLPSSGVRRPPARCRLPPESAVLHSKLSVCACVWCGVQFANSSPANMALGVFILWLGW